MLNKCFLILFVIFFTCCKHQLNFDDVLSSSSEFNVDKSKFEKNIIQTTVLNQFDSINYLRIEGAIYSPEKDLYQVTLPFPGTIKKLFKTKGSEVLKGTILAEIENPLFLELKSEYLTKKSELDYFEQNFSRQGELAMEQATSLKKLEEAQKNYIITEIQAITLSEKLKLIGINPQELTIENLNSTAYLISPAKGNIVNVNIVMGKYYSETEELFSISNSSSTYCKFYIPNLTYTNLLTNNKIEVWYSQNHTLINGKIHTINSSNNDSLLFIEVELNNKLNDGIEGPVYGKFDLSEDYLLLPEECIVKNNYLLMKTGSFKFKSLKISPIITINGFVVITKKDIDLTREIVCKDAHKLIQQ